MTITEALTDFHRTIVLDGGLATELEKAGHDLNHPLWSAKLLLEDPNAIQKVGRDFLEAGSNIVTTATYQATFEGLAALGISRRDAESLFRKAIQIAVDARSEFRNSASSQRNVEAMERDIWIAASLGPYGAFLHDGSEYRGDYGLTLGDLIRFHEERLDFVASLPIDVLAFETFPSLLEAKAVASLLKNHPHLPAWISFTCRDSKHTSAGDEIRECGQILDSMENVVAVGCNCMAPSLAKDLVAEWKTSTVKPIVIYPNNGQIFSAVSSGWSGKPELEEFASVAANAWRPLGARMIGGCCGVSPQHIRQLHAALAAA